jgi:hypothetical protein
MTHRRFGVFVPQRHPHRFARQRLEGRRTDEAGGIGGQDDLHLRAGVEQPPHQIGSLVGGDATTHPQQDALPGQLCHVGSFLRSKGVSA